jgi:hypothetical protein
MVFVRMVVVDFPHLRHLLHHHVLVVLVSMNEIQQVLMHSMMFHLSKEKIFQIIDKEHRTTHKSKHFFFKFRMNSCQGHLPSTIIILNKPIFFNDNKSEKNSYNA